MQFLDRDEAKLQEEKLRRQIADRPRPKLVLYYKSGHRDYADAANAIATAAGAFTEATLHFLFCVSGDGWNDDLADSERWAEYRRWRSANGEHRRLYDAPGHRFEAGETVQLASVIQFALRLGWDALIAAKPGRQILFLSHDDRMEIYRGFEWRRLGEKLIKLGYWQR